MKQVSDEISRIQKMSEIENGLYLQGYRRIAGVDEAGRGPLAGPVVAAACILPQGFFLKGLNDSKKLSAQKRNELFQFLTNSERISYAVGIVDAKTIDKINILQATFQAMREAILKLALKPDIALIDGNLLPPLLTISAKAVVKGDLLSVSIAAASIIAKKTRDDLMDGYHQKWPEYGFLEHKGYGTKKHLEAIEKLGPVTIHRLSFAPLKS